MKSKNEKIKEEIITLNLVKENSILVSHGYNKLQRNLKYLKKYGSNIELILKEIRDEDNRRNKTINNKVFKELEKETEKSNQNLIESINKYNINELETELIHSFTIKIIPNEINTLLIDGNNCMLIKEKYRKVYFKKSRDKAEQQFINDVYRMFKKSHNIKRIIIIFDFTQCVFTNNNSSLYDNQIEFINQYISLSLNYKNHDYIVCNMSKLNPFINKLFLQEEYKRKLNESNEDNIWDVSSLSIINELKKIKKNKSTKVIDENSKVPKICMKTNDFLNKDENDNLKIHKFNLDKKCISDEYDSFSKSFSSNNSRNNVDYYTSHDDNLSISMSLSRNNSNSENNSKDNQKNDISNINYNINEITNINSDYYYNSNTIDNNNSNFRYLEYLKQKYSDDFLNYEKFNEKNKIKDPFSYMNMIDLGINIDFDIEFDVFSARPFYYSTDVMILELIYNKFVDFKSCCVVTSDNTLIKNLFDFNVKVIKSKYFYDYL